MLKKLLHTIRVAYWRQMYGWHCSGVYHYVRIEPHPPGVRASLNKARYYKGRLESLGEEV